MLQKCFTLFLKVCKRLKVITLTPIDKFITIITFYGNGVKFSNFHTFGIPKINVSLGGRFRIGTNFKMNNREMANPIGRFNKCSFIIEKNGLLTIGDNVGMSSTAIVCHNSIEIGDNVKIGGNVVVYDTDFHSLNSEDRLKRAKDLENTNTKPIKIDKNAFIGAHSTILKGVTIGENSIIGACSVVTKNIPDNQVWGGSPAKFIAKLEF